MTTAQLTAATNQFDREFIADTSRSMMPEERAEDRRLGVGADRRWERERKRSI